MLSRTADHLYWMARYTERAENIARILDITNHMTMLQSGTSADPMAWQAVITIAGNPEQYTELYGEVTPLNAMQYLSFDTRNPSSIKCCLQLARENAHAVRGTLTSELWETINATWIQIRDTNKKILNSNSAGDFFEWVMYRSHLSRGVTMGTMLQDDSLWFTRIGTYLERADNTARILDVQSQRLLAGDEAHDASADYYRWGALLRSVSGFEIYRRVYRDRITPQRVAELLILRNDMPRSLHRCFEEITSLLAMVANQHSAETERCAGLIHAKLHFGRIEEIFEKGLHNFLQHFVTNINTLGNRIANDFLIPHH